MLGNRFFDIDFRFDFLRQPAGQPARYRHRQDFINKQCNIRQPAMKGIYRVLEKGVFKYNAESTDELELGQVRDLVRGGIIDLTMRGLGVIAQYILASDEVTVCRVKDRFNEPSPAGWADLMVNFYLNDDPGKHMCEVQLIHFKMLSQRTTQEGHDAYNVYRVCCVDRKPCFTWMLLTIIMQHHTIITIV